MFSRTMGYLQTGSQLSMLREGFSCLERHKFETDGARNDSSFPSYQQTSNNFTFLTLLYAKATTRITEVYPFSK